MRPVLVLPEDLVLHFEGHIALGGEPPLYLVSRPALRQLWGEHRDGRRNHSHRLWSLLMLEFWFREFIDGDAADLPLEYAMVKAA